MNPELLWVFIPTIAAISLTPGMCMTLAFTLGLSQGYRQTLWMMGGELAGVATVVISCALLLAWIQSLSDVYFTLLALVGGSYLLWVAYRLWTQPAQFERGEGPARLAAAGLAEPRVRYGRYEPERLGLHDCPVTRFHVARLFDRRAAQRLSRGHPAL